MSTSTRFQLDAIEEVRPFSPPITTVFVRFARLESAMIQGFSPRKARDPLENGENGSRAPQYAMPILRTVRVFARS